jgi:hypothetical protein
MKKIAIFLYIIFLVVGHSYAQKEVITCGHDHSEQKEYSTAFGQFIIQKSLKNLNENLVVLPDPCGTDNMLSNQISSNVKKIIPVVFHIVQDASGQRNFPDDPGTVKILKDIIGAANQKLANNQVANLHNGPTPPPVQDINIEFEYKNAVYYTSTSWPGFSNYTYDDLALNVRLLEKARRWAPDPEQITIKNTVLPTCNSNDGSVTFAGLRPGASSQWGYVFNGADDFITGGPVQPNAQGEITIPLLEAGNYTDVHFTETGYNQRSSSINISLKNQASHSIFPGNVTKPSSCNTLDGRIPIGIGGLNASQNVTVYYTFRGINISEDVTLSSSSLVLEDLDAGSYTNIRVEAANGCISNSLSVSLGEQGSDGFTISEIKPDRGPSNGGVRFSGLTLGQSYYYRISRVGHTYTSAVKELKQNTDDEFWIRSLSAGYYELFRTDRSGCKISDAIYIVINEDQGPSGVAGTASPGNTYLNMFDAFHRHSYGLDTYTGPPVGEPYTEPRSYPNYLNFFGVTLIHEFGHLAGLPHPFKKSNSSWEQNCSDVYVAQNPGAHNNFMDWIAGPDKTTFVPCQIEQIHDYINSSTWEGRFRLCEDPTMISDLQHFIDYSTGLLTFLNFGSVPTGATEFYSASFSGEPGQTYYSDQASLQFSLEEYAGQTIDVCARIFDADACIGPEDCESVQVPGLADCSLDQVTDINIIFDQNGIPISLDPSSLSSKPHFWTFSSQNGTTLSGLCDHNPDIIYSPDAEINGDVIDVCVSVISPNSFTPCTTEVCTTIVLPPSIPRCFSSLRSGDFFYFISEQNTPFPTMSPRVITLEALTYTSFIYEHTWVVTDRISGEEKYYTGKTVELFDGPDFTSDDYLIDLEVCHIIKNKFKNCLVAYTCENISYNCEIAIGIEDFLIFNESVNSARQLIFTLDLFGIDGPNVSDITYRFFINNRPIEPVLTPITNEYLLEGVYQLYGSCGTFNLQIQLEFEDEGIGLCIHENVTITYGPQPCKPSSTSPSPAVLATKSKREGTVDGPAYTLAISFSFQAARA